MLGISALAGIAMIPATAPIAIWNSRKIYGEFISGLAEIECDKVWLKYRDARTSATKEFLTSIKPIKVSLSFTLLILAQCLGTILSAQNPKAQANRSHVSNR